VDRQGFAAMRYAYHCTATTNTSHRTERSRRMQREEMIILAGKYLTGLLSKQDAADTERRMETDPAFRSIVAQWQERLADLNDLTEPIEPSSDLWERIVRQLKNPPENNSHR
jgi:anti-sigma-K factor RskA